MKKHVFPGGFMRQVKAGGSTLSGTAFDRSKNRVYRVTAPSGAYMQTEGKPGLTSADQISKGYWSLFRPNGDRLGHFRDRGRWITLMFGVPQTVISSMKMRPLSDLIDLSGMLRYPQRYVYRIDEPEMWDNSEQIKVRMKGAIRVTGTMEDRGQAPPFLMDEMSKMYSTAVDMIQLAEARSARYQHAQKTEAFLTSLLMHGMTSDDPVVIVTPSDEDDK